MANTFSPNGLVPRRRVDGASWTGSQTAVFMSSTNTASFFFGDPVVRDASGTINTVLSSNAPTQGTLGIFVGCEYLSKASGNVVWTKYYPGSDASSAAPFTGYIVDDPNVVYGVWVGSSGTTSVGGGPLTFSSVGTNYNWALGTGNTANGISGAFLDASSSNTTNTLQLTMINVIADPPGVNGTDTTTAGNMVEVVLNQQAYKVGTTGV